MEEYLLARGLHVLSAFVLFGTGLGSAYHFHAACRSGDVAGIARVARQTVQADWLFTTPAAVAQPVTGLWLVRLSGYGYTEPWLVASYVLYAVAGAAWLVVVALQIEMERTAALARRGETPLPDAFHRRFRLWVQLGWIGFGSLLAVIALMVAKPPLW